MTRSTGLTLSVSKTGQEEWSVREGRSGGGRGVFHTKQDAVKAARRIVGEKGGVLEVQDVRGRTSTSFTLGRAAMTKLNAVEGVELGRAGAQAFETFDAEGLTPAQRRASLRKDLAKLAVGTHGTASRGSSGAKPSKKA